MLLRDCVIHVGHELVMTRFHTIGHSNRTFEEFAEILRAAQVGLVVDIRSFPRSRSNPVYNIDGL